jgi:hypothetical protein
MQLLHRENLGATLDVLSEALFFGNKISPAQRAAAAKWIAGRQGLPGAYANMFAPTDRDLRGIRLFTGELVTTRVGIAHVLGEESCRMLKLLRVPEPRVRAALARALAGMTARLELETRRGYCTGGFYCCGTCSASYWRNLALHLFPRAEERLRNGLRQLKQLRRGDGTWRRFPFYYTSLAMTEIGTELARAEMQYAAARWCRILPRLAAAEYTIARRRAAVGQRLLEQCKT